MACPSRTTGGCSPCPTMAAAGSSSSLVTVLDPDDVVGEFHHAFQTMLRHQDCDRQVVHQTGDGRQHLLRAGRIECARRLVEGPAQPAPR